MLISSRFVKIVSPLAIAIALASCGGAGNFGEGASGSGNTTQEGGKTSEELFSSIDLQVDTLGLTATSSVNITAIVKDEANSAISDAEVTFSVDNNATLVVTDNSAVLTSNGAVPGTILTVTATAGTISKTVQIIVTERGDGQAADLEFSASSRVIPSDGSSPITLSATAKDANNNAISNADITFAVDNGATITTGDATGSVVTATLTPGDPENRTLTVIANSGNQSKSITIDVIGTTVTIDGPDSIVLNKDVPYVLKLKDSSNKAIAFEPVALISTAGNTITITSAANDQTDQNGEISFTLRGVGGTDTLKATVLGVEYEKDITISADEFELSSVTSTSDEININSPQTITVAWTVSGVPQANKLVTISATRGNIANPTVTTDSSGRASFIISSPTAGQTVISATTATGLSTSLNKEFVATTPAYLNTQADPSLITPNGSSTIIAKIRDINDNPVKNKTIDFRLNDTVDGVLSASTAVTDSLGRASVSYIAGNSSSAKDGVVIKTFIQGFSIAEDEVFLTVGGDALRIVLGNDQLVATDEIFYVKKYGVIVTDSAGNPINEQAISFTITPTHYYKGFMRVVDTDGDGEADRWVQYLTAPECLSEDFDKDGNLDAGEDLNNNGTLEPTHDAAITGSGVTDDQGKILVEIVYPKSRALWSKQTISATTLVEGTEFVEYTDLVLPIAADDVTDVEVGVPNAISPYGISNSCFDDNATFDTPIVAQIVNAVTKAPVSTLIHDVWYTAQFVDALGNQVSSEGFTIESSVVDITEGPANTFKLFDKDTATDDSGFFITLTVDGVETPLFYQDDVPAVSNDTEAPILTLNGSSSINIEQGTAFTDPGANAIDVVDGVIDVTITGDVNSSVLGTYTLIYAATDAAGNQSTLTRTVTVVTVGSGTTDPDVVLGAVEYVGAEPQTILLQGMSAPGLQHTSTVTFLVKDDVGNPIANEDVSFELTSSVGGTRLTSTSVKTDSQGFAKAILQAGTVHTSVRVRASITLGGNTLSSESSQVVISTGIADQNSLSLTLSTLNPSAWDFDGETVNVNMFASDRYNNPVPDGTSVAFYTELGQIQPSCQTTNGACVVTWTSSDPRSLGITPPGVIAYADDGRSTITAAVIGEESFTDTNSNGIFDDGDLFDANSDKGEAFEDFNENGIFDAGLEPFLDFNGDGVRNPKNGNYTGLACEHTSQCASGSNLKDIYTSIDLILAEVSQNVVIKDSSGTIVTTLQNGINYTVEVSGSRNNQIPPAGTTISSSSDEAEIVLGNSEVPNSNATGVFTMALLLKDKDPTVVENGLIKLTVTTPKGLPQELIFNYVDTP